MKAHRPLRVVGFFLDIGRCVIKDHAEIQTLVLEEGDRFFQDTFYAYKGHPDGDAVVGCGLVGGPGRHGFVQHSGLFQVLGLLMNCDNKLE